MGSGKTTTLYAALGEVNSPHRNIVTIEDPIEYQLPGINQVQVDSKVSLSFAAGLRSILRQDANVLMVGEIRDQETALVAGRAASTGHLILSTLHTNSAVGAMNTLRNLGLPSYVIANTLICVVAQRLVRVVCQECAEKRRISKSEAVSLGLGERSRRSVLRAVGCEKCYHTGYVGRTGVYEILENTPKVAALIADEKGEAEILKAASTKGHKTLIEAAARKVIDGTTTPEEVFRTIAV
jgi:type II secretory ATPase GspE/PulE/Tfp pilus assembly ATPase PilB-like protein